MNATRIIVPFVEGMPCRAISPSNKEKFITLKEAYDSIVGAVLRGDAVFKAPTPEGMPDLSKVAVVVCIIDAALVDEEAARVKQGLEEKVRNEISR